MELSFKGRRALVTGAGKGLGRGIALKLAECGAQVVAISRTQSDLDSLKEQVPSIESHIVDLTDWDATRKAVETIGHVDLLVNNAGVSVPEDFIDVTKETLISLFDLNFKAAFNVTQVIAKRMIQKGNGGSVVMMSSILSSVASQSRSVYCCSKAALDQLTRCLALELGPYQIRVNSINPTVVLTPMTLAHGWDNPEKASKITSRTPLGRIAEVKEVVNTTLFLLSNKVTGWNSYDKEYPTTGTGKVAHVDYNDQTKAVLVSNAKAAVEKSVVCRQEDIGTYAKSVGASGASSGGGDCCTCCKCECCGCCGCCKCFGGDGEGDCCICCKWECCKCCNCCGCCGCCNCCDCSKCCRDDGCTIL